jgi:hypothetical protein
VSHELFVIRGQRLTAKAACLCLNAPNGRIVDARCRLPAFATKKATGCIPPIAPDYFATLLNFVQ